MIDTKSTRRVAGGQAPEAGPSLPVPAKETMLEFHARGSIREQDASFIGTELLNIREKDGHLTAYSVVEASRDPSSPLHRFFEWDDTTAAEAYRRAQARLMIASLIVTPVGAGITPTRAFFSITNGTGRSYRPLNEVLESEVRLTTIVRRLQGDLRRMRERYLAFRGLAAFAGYNELFEAIEKALNGETEI